VAKVIFFENVCIDETEFAHFGRFN